MKKNNIDIKLQETKLEKNKIEKKSESIKSSIENTRNQIEELEEQVFGENQFKDSFAVIDINENNAITSLNENLNKLKISKNNEPCDLTKIDILVSIVAGIIASIVDILFVGSPEVVKIWKSGERFDRSIFTNLLRKIGNGDDKLSKTLNFLCEKCKVPYDLSNKKGVVNPNNHRLRNIGHDPLLGLLFATADIIMGTATLIDTEGHITVTLNPKDMTPIDKWMSFIYYFGHLLSDVCTSRGLPIPGFFLTQFFADGNNDNSIAKIAEGMYKDGYDCRHLVSMSIPVMLKNVIINLYLTATLNKNEPYILQGIAQRELLDVKQRGHKYKMLLISDAVCCGGNILKFYIPPTSGNITALNLPEWISLINNTIACGKYTFRNKDVETVLNNRNSINQNWDAILNM